MIAFMMSFILFLLFFEFGIESVMTVLFFRQNLSESRFRFPQNRN